MFSSFYGIQHRWRQAAPCSPASHASASTATRRLSTTPNVFPALTLFLRLPMCWPYRGSKRSAFLKGFCVWTSPPKCNTRGRSVSLVDAKASLLCANFFPADDSVGFWHVAKHPSQDKNDDWSRVYYSVQLRIPSWIPGIVIGYLNKKAIREVCFSESKVA